MPPRVPHVLQYYGVPTCPTFEANGRVTVATAMARWKLEVAAMSEDLMTLEHNPNDEAAEVALIERLVSIVTFCRAASLLQPDVMSVGAPRRAARTCAHGPLAGYGPCLCLVLPAPWARWGGGWVRCYIACRRCTTRV